METINQFTDNQPETNKPHYFSSFISSDWLKRKVRLEIIDSNTIKDFDKGILLLNDGQDMRALGIEESVETLMHSNHITPVAIVGIHAGERKAEYGVTGFPDYMNRGAKAKNYELFIKEELLPYLGSALNTPIIPRTTFFAGCSLGGLSAFDIAISNPEHFGGAGVFSGSFWWRSKGYEAGYTENDRIIFHKLQSIKVHDQFRCWLMAGTDDERNDRNRNGIIDSVNDTLDLYDVLCGQMHCAQNKIQLIIAQGGCHNQVTWKKYFPEFLKFAFGIENTK